MNLGEDKNQGKILITKANWNSGGFRQEGGSPCSNLLRTQAARRKEAFYWKESWQPGDPSTPTVIYDVCFQEQVVTNAKLNSEEMQTIIGSLQRAVKPRDGANKDAQGVGAESVIASVAPSKLSGLCASLA